MKQVRIDFRDGGFTVIEAIGFIEVASYLAAWNYHLWDIKTITVLED